MMKKALWIIIIILVIGGGYIIYLWFKPHRNIAGEKAEFETESAELIQQYRSDENGANALYLDKVIIVRGTVIERDDNHIKMEDGIYCNGDFSGASVSEGETVTVKGRIVGYDELFEEIRMDHCTLE